MTFPLYDNLINDAKNKDLTAKQKIDLIKKIDKIDENGTRLIYALIKAHSLNDGSNFSLIPYDGSKAGQDVNFDLERLPNKLKQVLYKFTELHDKSLQ